MSLYAQRRSFFSWPLPELTLSSCHRAFSDLGLLFLHVSWHQLLRAGSAGVGPGPVLVEVGGWTDRRMDGWIDGWVVGCMRGWTTGGWMDGQVDGWMDKWMDGWVDEWMSG